MNDKKVVGSSYLITFYQEAQELTHNASLYNNLVLELENTYGKDFDKADHQIKQAYQQMAQLVRINVDKTHIQYESLKNILKEKLEEEELVELKSLYEQIINTFVIKRNDLRKYVLLINKILVKEVIQELLTSSQEIASGVYETW